MKQILQLLFMGFFPVILFSQTPEEKITITKDYDNVILTGLAKSFKSEAEFEKTKALELAKQNGWDIRKEEKGVTYELMKISEEGIPLYYVTSNVNAALSTRANTLHNGGLLGLNVEGQNMTAHVWDAGLARSTHQEYDGAGGSNRFSIGDGTSALHYHSAHVTGTIIASGYVASAKGMAPQAYAVGYEWNNDISEATTAAGSGMLLSNHSYGWGASSIPDWYFGAYIDESRDWDAVMYNAPYYLMVVAAGNDGNDNTSNGNPLDGNSSYDKLSGHTTCKNNMVVANAQDASIDASGNLISVSINTGSSEGPTDDYRIKPDITGNGTSLYSSEESSDNDYNTLTGTSMASPNVCGTLLLLQKHYHNLNASYMRAATLKGLALHTADDAGPAGPDAVYGWGLLNAKAAANAITNNANTSLISQLSLNQGGTYTLNVTSDGTNNLIASISWTDPAGTANTGIANDPTPALVNDLDIRVTQGGTTYYPYRLTSITTNGTGDNDVDPFEKIIIAGASGTYTITVSHKGTLSGGSQNFSLIVTGRTAPATPPVANFIADNTMPSSSMVTVNFTDQSSNVPSSWLWSFNPSTVTYVTGSSTSQNPSVRFNNPGAYTVTLTATNAYGSDSETKTDYIHMGQPGVWTGSTSTDWNTTTNWENHMIPTSSDNVFIYPTAINWPTKTGNFTIGTDCNILNLTNGTEMTVIGNLTINSGKTLNMVNTCTLKIGGNWTNNGTFSPGSGTVEILGSGSSVINSPVGGTVYLINDAISTWPGNWNGDIGSGQGYFNQNATSNAGGVSPEVRFYWINSTTTKRLYYDPVNTTGLSSLSLNFKHMVDHYAAGYTIKIQYSTDGTTWFDAGWSVTPSGNISATNVNLALTGSQGVGAANYYIAFTITGNLYNIDYWYFDNVQLSYTASGGETFNNLVINKPGNTVTTNGNITVNSNFTINPNAYFTNVTGNTFTVNGPTLFMADNTGIASFMDNGTSSFTIAPDVQLYLSSNRWHFVSSPVNGALTGVFVDNYLRSFDETTYTWNPYITPLYDPLAVMLGYAAWVPGANPDVVTFQGMLNNGNLSIGVTNTSSLPDNGWNLVGNPYPSSLDWDAAGWGKANISNTIYYYGGTGGGLQNYHYYVGSGTAPYTGIAINDGTNEIPPMQAFFVHAISVGNLTVSNSARIHSGQSFYKSGDEEAKLKLIRMEVSGSEMKDETVIRFMDQSTEDFDGQYDAFKLFANNYPQVYTRAAGTDFAINTLPYIGENQTIPVYFTAATSQSWSLSFTQINSFAGEEIFLEDLMTGEIYEVTEGFNLNFDYSPLDEDHRFLLHFSKPMKIQNITIGNISVYSFDRSVYVQLPEKGASVISIYDLLGQDIMTVNSADEALIKISPEINSGYYLVKVQTGNHVITQKVFIR